MTFVMEIASSFGHYRFISALLFLARPEVGVADEFFHDHGRHHVTSVGAVLGNQPLIVGTLEAEPYLMSIGGDDPDDPKRRLTGFIPDLLLILSRRLDFDFQFQPIHPPLYGVYDNASNSWTGLMGELTGNKTPADTGAIHLAAAPMTITLARQEAVDFVRPFQNLGLSIILQRTTPSSSSLLAPVTTAQRTLFRAWQPMEPSLWATTFALFMVVWALLWLMNIYNPHEYGCRYKLGLADKPHAELFNVGGAFWFLFSTLQWQGFERAPRSVASKFLGCVWFAYVTLFLTTYVAGVVNTLVWYSLDGAETAPNTERPPIIDLAHLLSTRSDYKVGCINESQTYRYLTEVARGHEFRTLREQWSTDEGRANLVPNLTEGLRRVRTEKYALIVEGMVARLHTNRRPCDLVTIGAEFGVRSYGLALPKGSPLLHAFNSAILELSEDGTLEELERRWYLGTGQCWNVTAAERTRHERSRLYAGSPKRIDANDFWGPLVFVIVGVIVTCVIAGAELVFFRYKGKYSSTSNNAPLQGQHMRLDPDEGNM